jgi:hypothetical protein
MRRIQSEGRGSLHFGEVALSASRGVKLHGHGLEISMSSSELASHRRSAVAVIGVKRDQHDSPRTIRKKGASMQ